jgi:electron transfer flavoprotein beta subunit
LCSFLNLTHFDLTKIAMYSMVCKGDSMRIAVCIKQVPDTETKIKIKADATGIDPTGVKWIISPYDEHAIEEAIKLRDAQPGSQAIVFSVGPKARIVEALRTALAMGIDEAVAVDSAEDTDNLDVAKLLAAAVQKEGAFDLVLTGKLAIDDNSAAVGQMLAEQLKIPHTTVVSKLTLEGGIAVVEREVEGGKREIVELSLPALLAANKGLNTPRYASLPGIMKAKKKTIKEYDLSALGLTVAAKVRYSDYKLPPEKPAVKILSGDLAAQAKELAGLLRNEAKVI